MNPKRAKLRAILASLTPADIRRRNPPSEISLVSLARPYGVRNPPGPAEETQANRARDLAPAKANPYSLPPEEAVPASDLSL